MPALFPAFTNVITPLNPVWATAALSGTGATTSRTATAFQDPRMIQPLLSSLWSDFARAHKPDGYLLSSYRIATAPEPNSSRLTSFKSTGFDSPANNVGPWPASLGCTTNSYSSINPSSANASGSFTPPTNSPLPDSCLSC